MSCRNTAHFLFHMDMKFNEKRKKPGRGKEKKITISGERENAEKTYIINAIKGKSITKRISKEIYAVE